MVDTPGGSGVSQRPFANPISSMNSNVAAAANSIALPSVIESSSNALRDRLFPSNQGIAPLPSLGSTSNKPDSSSNAMVGAIGAIGASGTTVPLPSLATSSTPSSGERNELTRLPSFQHTVSQMMFIYYIM